jgi:solute carrier family 35 (UDP-xylose/UDP-N-acetylglucosamine transporter), member B4
MSHSVLSAGISIALLWDWATTLSLVFGGCCRCGFGQHPFFGKIIPSSHPSFSNAITLEQLTSQYPHAGTLITFFQFLLISLVGLPHHITFWPPKGNRKLITEKEAEEQLLQGAVNGILTTLHSHSSSPLRVALICQQETSRLEAFSMSLKSTLRSEIGHDNIRFTSGHSTPVGTEMNGSILTSTDSEIASTVHEHESTSVILTEVTPEFATTSSDITVHIVDSSTVPSFPQPRHDATSRVIADVSGFSLVVLRPDQPPVFQTYAPPSQSAFMSWITSIYWRLSALPFPRLKARNLPLELYFIQITLFYVISRLNNAAFGYEVPMSVHIIFRSGGLIVSMLLGWLVAGKRYNYITLSYESLLMSTGPDIT